MSLQSKVVARAIAFGPVYPVKSFAVGERGGSYNLVAALLVVLVVCASFGRFNPLLTAFVTMSTFAAFLIDGDSMKRKLDPAALPAQLVVYGQLVLLWLRDIGPCLALNFVCYTLVEPYWKKLCLWEGNSFWRSRYLRARLDWKEYRSHITRR
jgi:hypothetical protein